MPPPSYPVPRYAVSSDDDNTEPSSDMASASASASASAGGAGAGAALPAVTAGGRGPVKRSASFGKFLKTPLKLKHSLSATNETKGGPPQDGKGTPSSTAGDTALMSPPPPPRRSRGGVVNPANDDDDDLDDEGLWAEHEVKPLVYGYLYKLGRNGQWQRRFFETGGECLTYYKSRKRTKLLASLDLLKVGEIKCDEDDPDGCVFSIQVSDRPYYLRAETRTACKDWVISLNRVREARMEIGGIQLVQPHFSHEKDAIEVGVGGDVIDRSRSESDEYAARVIMIANRTRTRAIATTETEESLKKMIGLNGPVSVDDAPPSPGAAGTISAAGSSVAPPKSPRFVADHLPPVVLARWHKRRTNLQRLKFRLTQWARKINIMACTSMHLPVHQTSQEYTPDAKYSDAAIGGQLSDIDEHSGRDQQVHQVGSALSGGSAQSGEYEGKEIESREIS